jgi:hypothetical protein
MTFDHRRLRLGELVAAGSALLLFLFMFIDWYGLKGTGFGGSAWDVYDVLDLYLLVVIIVAVGLAVTTGVQRAPALPIAASVIVTVLGVIAALLVLYRIINQPGPNEFITVELGAYLGLLACLGIALGGYMAMRDEGTTMADARAQAQRMVSSREPTDPPRSEPAPAASESEPAAPSSTPPPAERFPGEPPPAHGV